ncbi:MAG: hypothetical protein QOD71_2101 [Thermoleophilaceae bacterium]|jgi:hypothetical protein|nr:hypothetical protein [Thermoleophilaceae bacterium]
MKPLRSLAALFACLTVLAGVAVAGCGSDDGSSSGLGTVLSFVPADTPFAVSIDTDLEGDQYKSLDAILNRFPGADTIKALLKARLTMGQEGVDFDKDIKPLLGNPAVISATDITSFLSDTADSGFVAALQVKDTDALNSLVEKTKAKKLGDAAGATEYQDQDTFFAVKDDVVVLAGSRLLLEDALKRADGGDSLSEDDFNSALDGLPDSALARVYVDVQGLLGQGEGAKAARKIAWVDALRKLGLTVSAHKDSIDVEFNLHTDAGSLSEKDLPLASGDEAAQVVQRPGEIGVGLRDPNQLVTFFESALQAVDPNTFGDYEQGKRALSAKLDLDVDKDLIAQLTGNLSVSATIQGQFGIRAEVKDPAAFAQTVDKVAKALPEFGSGLGVEGVRRSGDLYEARLSGGGTFVFGMAGGALVAATDSARAHALASAKPAAVEGASGSLVVRADAQGIARQILARLAPQFGLPDPLVPVFARPFDELLGSVATTTDGMKGKFSLTLD